MARPRDPNVRSKVEWCSRCGDDTEWRLNKVGHDKHGGQRVRWRCVECRKRERGET